MMKRYIFLIFNALLASVFCNAQEISVSMNYSHSGRNCALTYIQAFKKSEAGIGLRYNINSFAHPDDQANVFYKRQYATEPLHHYGAKAYYNRYIGSMFFAFYDAEISYSKTFNRMYVMTGLYDPRVENPTREDMLYKKHFEYFGPFTWIEQYIGMGLKVNLSESIILRQKAGVGIDVLLGSDRKLPDTVLLKAVYEFGLLFSIELAYKF